MARPKKSEEERRDLQVNVRLSAIEHAKLASRAAAAGVSLSDYMRQKSLTGRIKASPAETSSRVQTLNLRTDDPEKAWWIMVATAENQATLKKTAGMKIDRPKADQASLHLFARLASGAETVASRDARAPRRRRSQVLEAWTEHQALIVCHDDTAHPHVHVHVIVNRVHPETGLAAKISQDRLKLSRWAEAYERAGGKIFCQERVLNNARRDQGEFVKAEMRAAPRPSRLTEAVRPALNDNREAAERIKLEQRQKGYAALNQYGREMAARQKTALGELAARSTARPRTR